jgi:hypothetical protein
MNCKKIKNLKKFWIKFEKNVAILPSKTLIKKVFENQRINNRIYLFFQVGKQLKKMYSSNLVNLKNLLFYHSSNQTRESTNFSSNFFILFLSIWIYFFNFYYYFWFYFPLIKKS